MDEVSRTWFNYVPIEGAGPRYKDDGSQVLFAIELPAADGEESMQVALVGSNEQVALIRISSPNGEISPTRQRLISNASEHMLAILRLVHDQNLDRIRLHDAFISIGCYGDGGGNPSLDMTVQRQAGRPINPELVKVAFKSLDLRRQLTLLADSSHPMIPLPFKLLSLYKILELEMRVGKKWIDLSYFLKSYQTEFEQLGLSKRPLRKFIHHIRDRCAHIRTGSKNEIGLTGLNSDDAHVVRTFLPLLRKIVTDLLNQRYGKRLNVTLEP